MRISLEEFLRTGRLGKLRLGLSEGEVLALLGCPEDVGGTSRKYCKPLIYLYGSVEIHFDPKSRTCVLIYIECPIWKELRFPSHWEIMDWQLKPGMKREEIERILVKTDLQFKYDICYNQFIILSSGVTIGLDEDNVLFCISVFNR